MKKELYLELDVHQEVMIRAVAEAGRKGEVRQRAGRCGFGLARRLRQLGVECEVVARLTHSHPGERADQDRPAMRANWRGSCGRGN